MAVPKVVGFSCYYLIISSIILLVITLIASQQINLLHFTTANALSFDAQIGLSLLNCFITISAATVILSGNHLGRNVWHAWAIGYFMVNIWQLDEQLYLIPSAITLALMTLLLYSKPAQNYFRELQKAKGNRRSRRVDASYNIFDD